MFLTPKTKIFVIIIALIGMLLMMVFSPFLITSSLGLIASNIFQAFFIAIEFFLAIFLLNEIFRLQIIIKKEALSGEKLANIRRGIKRQFDYQKSSGNMRGIILAGGTATRLFPLTATTSKQLLPIYDKQMIFYPLNALIKAGIRDILIIISPEHSGQFINLLGSILKSYHINISFEVQKVPRGLADAFILGESFIGEDNVTLILGDNIFEDDISKDIREFKTGGHIFAKKVPDPERSGVVKFDDKNNVLQIVEKPQTWISDYAIPGIYVYDNRVIEIAKQVKPSDRGEIEIVDIHNAYLKLGELKVSVLDGEWLDAGTIDSLLEANNVVKERKMYENFHPILKEAIEKFNQELKDRTQRILDPHNLYVRPDVNKK